MKIDSKEPVKKVPIVERDYYISPSGELYNSKGLLLKGFAVQGVIFHEFFINKRKTRISKLDLVFSTWGDELFSE